MTTIQIYYVLLLAGSIAVVVLAIRQHKRKMIMLRHIVAMAKNIRTTAEELEKKLNTTTRFAQHFSISSYESFGRDISPFGVEPLGIPSPYFRITTTCNRDLFEASDNTPLTYGLSTTPKAKPGNNRINQRLVNSENVVLGIQEVYGTS